MQESPPVASRATVVSAEGLARWEAMFAALEAYHQKHGDCRVPQTYEANGLQLGSWVCHHRRHKPTHPERARRLEALGFRFAADADGGEDDRFLPARIKHCKDGMTPHGRIGCCMCSRPEVCRQLTYRWARLREANYVHCVRVPSSASRSTPIGRHVNAYRDAILRCLYGGGTIERTVTKHFGVTVTTDKFGAKEQVSMVHFHPDLIPHLLREKDSRKRKLDKFQVPHALGEKIGLREEDRAPEPTRDEDGLPSFFALPTYSLDAATADVAKAETAYEEKARRWLEENSGTVKQMKADPTKHLLEIYDQKEQIASLQKENRDLKERMKSKSSQQFATEDKCERLLKALEKMARRLDTWETSATVSQAPIQSAKDLYREATGQDLGEEGFYGIKSMGAEDRNSKGRRKKSWSECLVLFPFKGCLSH